MESGSYGSTLLAAEVAGHSVVVTPQKEEAGAFSRRLSRTVWTLCASSLTLHPKSFNRKGKIVVKIASKVLIIQKKLLKSRSCYFAVNYQV